MAYYIKAIGIKGEKISIAKGRFPRMLLFNMCFKNVGGKVKKLKKGDKFVIYCVKNGIREFLGGGFIGTQKVLSNVYQQRKLFKKPWVHIVDIQPEIYSLRNAITLKDVNSWGRKSAKMKKAIKAKLQAIGGILEIDRGDYNKFCQSFRKK